MVVHAFNSISQEADVGKSLHSEFQTSLPCIMSYRPVKTVSVFVIILIIILIIITI